MMNYLLILLCFAGTLAWDTNDYIRFRNAKCKGHSCSLFLKISPGSSSWYPIFINVTLGHSMRPHEGIVEIYDTINGKPDPYPKNHVAGNILSLKDNRRKTLGCYLGDCQITVCTSRGYSEVFVSHDTKEVHVIWTPMISFGELKMGPMLKFSYTMTNGVSGPLKLDSRVDFWGVCDEPGDPYTGREVYISVTSENYKQ